MADQRIQATENMVGANHPTLADTLNRLTLVEHNTDGTHKLHGASSVPTNLAIGSNALQANTTGLQTVALGYSALAANLDGSYNTAVGAYALTSNTSGYQNTAIGRGVLQLNTIGYNNTATGVIALYNNTEGHSNCAYGHNTMLANTTGDQCTAIGVSALASSNANNNTAVGANCMASATGGDNTAIGVGALTVVTGNSNTAIGNLSLVGCTSGELNVGIGNQSLLGVTTQNNCTGVGSNSAVTGSNQVQLGDTLTTTYAYGAVQNRSDARDKTAVRDTILGLSFIEALHPVDFKWDMREDYRTLPPTPPSDTTDVQQMGEYETARALWLESTKLANITSNGAKVRSRYHHGLIAQEVKQTLDNLGLDFGGYQDHSVNGGDDVLSIGYNELIAPLIKAVQELSARVRALEAQ